MPIAYIAFYKELGDFLPPQKREKEIDVTITPGMTIKALIEQLGVPHTEVDLVLVNGESTGFSRAVKNNDRICVYPVDTENRRAARSKVRPKPLRTMRFILDVHLGKLAKLLRLLGFDTLYSNSQDDATLALISKNESRIILTRDRELLKRKIVIHGYLIRSKKAEQQTSEVLARFALSKNIRPFSRCLDCNAILASVAKKSVRETVPQMVYERYKKFRRCPDCAKIYWQGSHWERMKEKIGSMLQTGHG